MVQLNVTTLFLFSSKVEGESFYKISFKKLRALRSKVRKEENAGNEIVKITSISNC